MKANKVPQRARAQDGIYMQWQTYGSAVNARRIHSVDICMCVYQSFARECSQRSINSKRIHTWYMTMAGWEKMKYAHARDSEEICQTTWTIVEAVNC